MSIACPHCQEPTRSRSSRAVAPTYKQLNLQCTNVLCGATFGADLTITHGISPSAIPNPELQLKMVAPRRRADNDNDKPAPPIALAPSRPGGAAVPANDDDYLGEAIGTGA